jgi:hypothetical protein
MRKLFKLVIRWPVGRMVMQRIANPLISVRFRYRPPAFFEMTLKNKLVLPKNLVDLYIEIMYSYKNGTWRSLVARLLWEQDVGGSNPLVPTIYQDFFDDFSYYF